MVEKGERVNKFFIVGVFVIASLFLFMFFSGSEGNISGYALWDSSHCTSSNPCPAGEGDCDIDAHCLTGYCAQNVGANYGQSSRMDVCESREGTTTTNTQPTTTPVINEPTSVTPPSDCHTVPLWDSSYCTTSCPCNAGEGDCDIDAHCLTGYCAQNVGANYGQSSGMDICENTNAPTPVINEPVPTTIEPIRQPSDSVSPSSCHTVPLWDSSYCTTSCPCNAGEGDCDRDYHCVGDLTCSQNVGANYGQSSNLDVCEGTATKSAPITEPPTTEPPSCIPRCSRRECGNDGCGGSCGSCSHGESCTNGQCVTNFARPLNCHIVPLWDSGYCTRLCPCNPGEGDCDFDFHCMEGECARNVGAKYGQDPGMDVCEKAIVPSCTPQCSGRECGSDGCGGSCGSCSRVEYCSNGQCVTNFARPLKCHTVPLWDSGYCTRLCPCNPGEGDCDFDFHCMEGECARNVGAKYGQDPGMDVCEGTITLYCGDGLCGRTETCDSCPPDCDCSSTETCTDGRCVTISIPPRTYCGDGTPDTGEQCDYGENNGNICTPNYGSICGWCDNSCNLQTETGAYCGDDTCNAGFEDYSTCPQDCEYTEEIEDADYYVSPDGSDSNTGTVNYPWRTWEHAFNTARAGDLVYFRGGVYYASSTTRITNSGTSSDPIRFFAYPGESPILDGSSVTGNGIFGEGVRDLYFKGLTVRFFRIGDHRPSGIYFLRSNNLVFENIVSHDSKTRGFYLYDCDNVYLKNCDAYNHFENGHGDGYLVWSDRDSRDYLEASVIFDGCRAWNNADDGWDAENEGYTEIRNSWAFSNGYLEGGANAEEGNGFKIGLNNQPSNFLSKKIVNSISAGNRLDGLTTNDGSREAKRMEIYNNFFYGNGDDDIMIMDTRSSNSDELRRIFRNNIAQNVEVDGDALYTHSHNSWDSGIGFSGNDFESLDWNQLYRPRKADGSLPDITFGKLRQGSNYINSGTNVGLSSNGAPDMGWHESSY